MLHNPAFSVKENCDINAQPRSVLLLCSGALKETIARQTAVVKM